MKQEKFFNLKIQVFEYNGYAENYDNYYLMNNNNVNEAEEKWKIKNKMKIIMKKKMKKIMILIIGIIYRQNQFEMPKFKYLKTEMKF